MVLPTNLEEYKESNIPEKNKFLYDDVLETSKRFAFCSEKENCVTIGDIDSISKYETFQGAKITMSTDG